LHITLLKDLRHPAHWALAVGVGLTGLLSNLAVALLGALIIWWTARAITAWRRRYARNTHIKTETSDLDNRIRDTRIAARTPLAQSNAIS
jgi:hypothetical protein